jgi:cell division protein FtsI (penicillin-binding protein 3)
MLDEDRLSREGKMHTHFHREKQSAEMIRSRLTLVILGFALLFIALLVRSTDAIIFDADKFKTTNFAKKAREHRPEIIDRNGALLATNLQVASVYVHPQEVLDVDEAYNKLIEVLPDVNKDQLKRRINPKNKFAWVKRNITPQEQLAINNLGIPGVYFIQEERRVYPNGKLLAHVLGYVDVDNNGIAGIESYLDKKIDVEGDFLGDEPLKLSIDLKVQHILQDELLKQKELFEAEGATAIVADVDNGEILGMVSLPDFDPNFSPDAKSFQKFSSATLGSYEMGSTFKPITAAMAFEYGTSNPAKLYDATNPIRVSGHTISDYHAKKRVLSVTEVMMYSSNIGSAKMALEVGTEKQKEFLKKLGLFDQTELEVSELGNPQLPKNWRELNTATIGFGHGFAITPAHLVKAYIPLVNGGNLIPLTLIKRKANDDTLHTRVISEKTSKEVTQMLRDIVTGGSGKSAEVDGYFVGGKTGTAEKLTDGRYDKGKLMSSFVAVFPTTKPKYVILVIFDDPKEQQRYIRPTGGITAAPVVKNVISRIAPVLGLKPELEDIYEKRNSI